MAEIRRRQRQQRWWPRWLSFRIVILLLLLVCALLAFAPALHFRVRSNQKLDQKCGWLRNRPLVCAHGGDTSTAPPNTLEAFTQALKAKADCVEIDASRSQDGVLLALHDRDLQDIYGNDYIRVGDLSFKEIIKVYTGKDFPKRFENQMVPTVMAALQHVSNHVKQIILDVKIGGPALVGSIAASVLSVVNVTHCKNCLVWSKDDSFIEELKRLSPDVNTGYIMMKDKMSNPTEIIAPTVVGAYHGIINAKLVRNIHKHGKMVYAWTVNDIDRMRHMLYHKVDGIVTNQPQSLRELMLQIQNECFHEGFSL